MSDYKVWKLEDFDAGEDPKVIAVYMAQNGKRHVTRNGEYFAVWCGQSLPYYKLFQAHASSLAWSSNCHACLEAVVRAGDEARDRILHLDQLEGGSKSVRTEKL